MSARTALLALALTVSSTSCGGDDPAVETADAATPSASASSAAPAPVAATMLTEAALESALLTEGDVPDGYASTPFEEPEPEEDSGVPCLDLVGSFESLGGDAPASAVAEFEMSDDAGVLHELFSYADEAAAKAVLADAREVVAECGAFTSEVDGVTIAGSVERLSLQGLAADGLALATTVTISGPGVPAETFSIDLALARAGTSLSLVTFSQGAETVDHEITERLGAKGLANLRKA